MKFMKFEVSFFWVLNFLCFGFVLMDLIVVADRGLSKITEDEFSGPPLNVCIIYWLFFDH